MPRGSLRDDLERLSLSDYTVRDLLTAFAVRRPTPAGGAASALVAAVGVSVLMKASAAANLPTDSLADLQRQLTDAIDADTSAYSRFAAARRLPATGSAEIAARHHAIEQALRTATEVPLAIARVST